MRVRRGEEHVPGDEHASRPAASRMPAVTGVNHRLSDLLVAGVGWVTRWPRLVLALAVVASILSSVYAVKRLEFKTNRDDLLHPSDPTYIQLRYVAQEFGSEPDIIVAVEGPDPARIAAAIDAVAARLAAQPNYFARVCPRVDARALRRKGLYYLPVSELRRLQTQIQQMQPVLSGLWGLLSLDKVLQATWLRVPAGGEEARQSATQVLSLVRALQHYLDTGNYQSPWAAMAGKAEAAAPTGFFADPQAETHYFFAPDQTMAVLRVTPVRDPTVFAAVQAPVDAARVHVAAVQAEFPELKLGLTGLPVLEADEMANATAASTRSVILSLIGVAVLFVIAFRALRHPLFAILSLILCGAWTMGWVTLTVGHLNVLSVSFFVTLVGLGIDFGILWISRYESERARGFDSVTANKLTARVAGPSLLVGAGTTAVAFFTTMTTEFLGLAEMGWIAGSGILLCLLGSFTILPALLVLGGRSAQKASDQKLARAVDQLPALGWLNKHATVTAVLVTAVVAWSALYMGRVRLDYNLLKLQPHGLPSVDWEHRLLERMGTSAWCAQSVANGVEEARRLRAEFERKPGVGQVVEIATLIPTDQAEKQPLIADLASRLANLPAADQPPSVPGPDAQVLRAALGQWSAWAATPAASAALGSDEANALRDAADRIGKALDEGDFADNLRRLTLFQNAWIDDLLAKLRQLQASASPEPITVADLPETLRERYYSRHGKWLIEVYANASVWDLEPLGVFCQQIREVDREVTGKPISTLHALSAMIAGYGRCALLATVVIFGLVLLDLRHLGHTLLAMVPLLLGCITMFGVMGFAGIALNPANMIALPLILGIGVDSGVHMIHDYRQSPRPYVLRWRLGRALLLTSLTTIIGFASLLTASHYGMMSIGLVLAIGVGASSISVFFFLPALLGWLHRRPRVRPAEARETLPTA